MFVYLNGLILGLSLVMALGPQNIFLIRQGAKRNHAALSAFVCFVCDIILVCSSIIGLHHVIEHHPSLKYIMVILGSLFLLFYGTSTLKNSINKQNEQKRSVKTTHSPWQIIILALGFSLLNPQAIIDTIVIIGSGSSQFPRHETAYLFGVLTSSLFWFSMLTITTHYFSDILSKTKVWKKIEFASGLLMIFMGIKLVFNLIY